MYCIDVDDVKENISLLKKRCYVAKFGCITFCFSLLEKTSKSNLLKYYFLLFLLWCVKLNKQNICENDTCAAMCSLLSQILKKKDHFFLLFAIGYSMELAHFSDVKDEHIEHLLYNDD